MEQEGKSVFFSTHITSDLDKIADYLVLIDDGRIILQEEKDTLLEEHRIVKGNPGMLSSEVRNLMINCSETEFSFSGVTKHGERLKQLGAIEIQEKPLIEDVMLAYIGGKK